MPSRSLTICAQQHKQGKNTNCVCLLTIHSHRLSGPVDVVVATPTKVLQHVADGAMFYRDVRWLVRLDICLAGSPGAGCFRGGGDSMGASMIVD